MGLDVRSMYDKEFLYAYDLQGRDITVTIAKVTQGKLVGVGGKSSKKPVIYFKGKEKGLGLCITNARIIAAIYGGFEVDKWVGRSITLYPTTTTFGGATVDCIRIRPTKPGKGTPVDESPDEVPPAREPGDDDSGEAAA